MKITVIGSGNGGQALAGWLAMRGFEVCLYGRNHKVINELISLGEIELTGTLNGKGKVKLFTTNLKEAVQWSNLILIATTANAHSEIAFSISKWLRKDHIIILNPGRTGGALEFRNIVNNNLKFNVYIAEAQTLIFACRLINSGKVNIIGVKNKVLFAAFPNSHIEIVYEKIRTILPQFEPAENILRTSLENIGAIFHPCVLLFNAATIERNNEFWFYRDMTPAIAQFIEQVDNERLKVGEAFDTQLLGVNDWISYAYPATTGSNLCEKMQTNPAYFDIKSPSSIFTRQITEDIPTGILPIMELGHIAGLKLPLMESITKICSSLLNIDFCLKGRSLRNLGLEGKSKDELKSLLTK